MVLEDLEALKGQAGLEGLEAQLLECQEDLGVLEDQRLVVQVAWFLVSLWEHNLQELLVLDQWVNQLVFRLVLIQSDR